jgi:hypothetical protein
MTVMKIRKSPVLHKSVVFNPCDTGDIRRRFTTGKFFQEHRKNSLAITCYCLIPDNAIQAWRQLLRRLPEVTALKSE